MFGFFLFEHNFRFQFMEISAANETTTFFWNSRKGETYVGCGISHRVFSFHLIFLLEVQELSVEWFVFRKFNNFRIFWKLSKKRVNHVTLFRKFWYFPLNGKRPLSSSCFGVFIDGVSLSHLAILCAWGEGRGGLTGKLAFKLVSRKVTKCIQVVCL